MEYSPKLNFTDAFIKLICVDIYLIYLPCALLQTDFALHS